MVCCKSKGCQNDPILYCDDCPGYYCEACFVRAHRFRSTKNHLRIERWKRELMTKIFEGGATENDISDDKTANNIVSVDPKDGNLVVEDNFYKILRDMDDICQPSFISFFGKTGHGKSTLLTIILQTIGRHQLPPGTEDHHGSQLTFPHPVIGATDSPDSTSSDLHLYVGPKVTDEQFPLLFFDTEGLDGTKVPKTLGKEKRKNRRKALIKATQSVFYFNKRRNHVDQSFPKLVYLFSDVICYISQDSWKEKKPIDRLIAWASQGSANIINQGIKPKLIIIYNKIKPEDFPNYDNIEYMTKEFFGSDPQRTSELYKFFTNPCVIFIPHSKELGKVSKQIEQLNQSILIDLLEIRKLRLKSLQLLTINNFQNCFINAIHCFNYNKSFDFNHYIRYYEMNDTSRWLIQFFCKCLKFYPLEKSIQLLKQKASIIIILHYLRMMIPFETGPNAKIHNVWKELLNNIIERCMDEFPCIATKRFNCKTRGTVIACCQSTRRTHYAGHQSAQTYDVERTWLQWWEGDIGASFACRWNGNYEAPNLSINILEGTEQFIHSLPHEWDKETISMRIFQALLQQRDDVIPLANAEIASASSSSSTKSSPYNKSQSNMCYGCFLNVSTEKICANQHSFCLACCKWMKNFYHSCCMFCNLPMNWKDTRYAGERVLLLSGNAFHAIQELFILSKIEEILNLPITSFFDTVIGNGIPSVLSAYLSCKAEDQRMRIQDKIKDIFIGIDAAYRLSFASKLLKLQSSSHNKDKKGGSSLASYTKLPLHQDNAGNELGPGSFNHFLYPQRMAVTSFTLLLGMICFYPIYFMDWAKANFGECSFSLQPQSSSFSSSSGAVLPSTGGNSSSSSKGNNTQKNDLDDDRLLKLRIPISEEMRKPNYYIQKHTSNPRRISFSSLDDIPSISNTVTSTAVNEIATTEEKEEKEEILFSVVPPPQLERATSDGMADSDEEENEDNINGREGERVQPEEEEKIERMLERDDSANISSTVLSSDNTNNTSTNTAREPSLPARESPLSKPETTSIKLYDAVCLTVLDDSTNLKQKNQAASELLEEKFHCLYRENKNCDYALCLGLPPLEHPDLTNPSSSNENNIPPADNSPTQQYQQDLQRRLSKADIIGKNINDYSTYYKKEIYFHLPEISFQNNNNNNEQTGLNYESLSNTLSGYFLRTEIQNQLYHTSAILLGSFFYVELMKIADNCTSIVIQLKSRQAIPMKTRQYLGDIRMIAYDDEDEQGKDKKMKMMGMNKGEEESGEVEKEEGKEIEKYQVKSPSWSMIGGDFLEMEFTFTVNPKAFPIIIYGEIEIKLGDNNNPYQSFIPISGIPIRIMKNAQFSSR